MKKQKKRIVYKECKIAGTAYHDMEDVWDRLCVGTKLALVREKLNPHDKNAVAVAVADDYDGDPEDFDFTLILGYVPRAENEYIAALLELGWAEALECELSQINGTADCGDLYMKIYLVSKEEMVITDHLLRVFQLTNDEYAHIYKELAEKGCVRIRWFCSPLVDAPRVEGFTLPDKGDKVVGMYVGKHETTLYLLYCMAIDDEAVEDDCIGYVLTNISGPIRVVNEQLDFLENEPISTGEPFQFISEEASEKLYDILNYKQ